MDSDMDSDIDWVLLDSDNPGGSSSDEGVLSLSSGCSSPDCLSDGEVSTLLALPSAAAPVDDGPEGLYDITDAEEVPQPPLHPSKPLAGLFHHMLSGDASFAAFDPINTWLTKMELIPDPAFSTCPEKVTVLASTRGLVCLRGAISGDYFVSNPATLKHTRLPRHLCDHVAHGDPAVVITFEDPYTCCVDHSGHYHIVVAFPLGEGIYAYESFSSRTWKWTTGNGISAVVEVVAASGVGALGRAFWRTTLGYFLCYNPAAGTSDLIPAPQEVLQWPYWELGEMNGTLCVTCMNDLVREVVVINLHVDQGAREIKWSLTAHFEGGCLRNRDRVELLRTQGPEVVMWDPMAELVVAMDLEGRTARTIGTLAGRQYYADFIPYVSASTGISRIEAGADCMAVMAAAKANSQAY